MNATVVFTATPDWLQVAERKGLAVDWDAEPVGAEDWDRTCLLCEFDPSDEQVGFAVLDAPRPQDTALEAGDVVATSGYGGKVVFLRRLPES